MTLSPRGWAKNSHITARRIFITGVTIAVVGCFSVLLGFRTYARAAIWHVENEPSVRLAGHELTVPARWWVSSEAVGYDTTNILRAHPAHTVPPVITVMPALPGMVQNSDTQLALTVGRAVAALRGMESRGSISIFRDESEVLIKSPSGTFYCERRSVDVEDSEGDIRLMCLMARVHYAFAYTGPQYAEKEAKSILSSFK
jgi:hypothetical protein